MARLFLALNTLFFLGFGVYALLNASQLAINLGTPDMSADGLYELRSNYGGVSLGAGLLCLLGALHNTFQRPALFFLLVYTGGYALGRVLALLFDGVPSLRLIGFGVFELVTAALAYFLLAHQAMRPSDQ